MIHTILKSFPIILLNFLSLVTPGQFDYLFAQNTNNNDLIPSLVNNFQYEIGEIRFVGNYYFSSSDLQSQIASKPTDRTYEHRILLYYDVSLKHPNFKKYYPTNNDKFLRPGNSNND